MDKCEITGCKNLPHAVYRWGFNSQSTPCEATLCKSCGEEVFQKLNPRLKLATAWIVIKDQK